VSLLRMITVNKAHTHKHTHLKPQARTLRRRDIYLATTLMRYRQTSMPPAGYEPAILVVNSSLIWIFWQLRLRGHLLHLTNQDRKRICHHFQKPLG